MKKILIGAAGLVLVILAGLLIVPNLIDWNEYKGEIASKIKDATGRDVSINGDLKISVVPVPTLVARDVRLANIKGASVADMATLSSLEVHIALAPLFGGAVQVESVRLVDAVVELEVLADGRRNWDFNIGSAEKSLEAGPAASGSGAEPGGFSLDRFSISNGTVIYRDRRSGATHQAEGMDVELSAKSISGPFEGAGRLIYQGMPFSFKAEIGRVEAGKAIPVNIGVGVESLDLGLIASGTLLGLPDAPRFQGKLKAEGSPTALMALAGVGDTVPGLLAQSFSVEGEITADAAGGAIEGLALRLGGASASGRVQFKTKGEGGTPAVGVDLKVSKIDLDRWLAMPPTPVPVFSPRQGVRVSTSGEGRKLMTIPAGGAKPTAAKPAVGAGAPKGINVSAAIGVDAIVYKGAVVSQGRINAEITNGEITISQLSAVLPGVTNVAAFGFIQSDGKAAAFEGDIEATTSDVRGLLGWLGVKDIGIPENRLRSFRFASKARATTSEVSLTRIALEFDQSRLTGGVTLALRDRLAFGANLTIDSLNLDHYLNAGAGAPSKKSNNKAVAANKKSDGLESAAAGMKAFATLDSFDANLKAKIGTLIHQGVRYGGIDFDGTLIAGGVSFRDVRVADIAGASVRGHGVLKGLGGLPEMEGINFEIATNDSSRLFELGGMKPPNMARTIGPVHFSGKADGSFLKPRLDAALKAAGGEVHVKGAFSFIPLTSPFEGRVSLRHGDMARLLSVLGSGYRPAEKIGGLDVSATLKADADQVAVSELTGQLGPVSLEGQVTISTAAARPAINARLQTGIIPVRLFLPREDSRASSASQPSARISKNRTAPAFQAGGGHLSDRWSKEAIDFSFMKGLDADIDLQAKGITFDTYSLSDASLSATLKNGVMTLSRLAGSFFGGPVTGTARVDASTSSPRMAASLRLAGMDVNKAVKAVAGKDMATGKMAVNLDLSTGGNAVAVMVSSMNGKGSLSISDLDVKASGSGTVLAGVIGLFSGLDNVLSSVLGGKQKKGLGSLGSEFNIDRGIVNLSNLQFSSVGVNGTAKGIVDLPGWLIDVNGQATIPDNLLAQVLTRNVSRDPLPFTIRGDLEAPDVAIKTASLTGGVKKGLGKVLDKTGLGGILGGDTAPAQPDPSGSQTPTETQPKKIKPEDVFKSILKGVIR